MDKRIFILLGFLFLGLGILSFFKFGDRESKIWKFLDKTEFKTEKFSENYVMDIPSYLRISDSPKKQNSIQYENLIREVYLSIEFFDYASFLEVDSIYEDLLFAQSLKQVRQKHAKDIVIDQDTIKKQISPSVAFELIDFRGAYFSMEMESIKQSPGTYFVFALFHENEKFILLTLATNLEFKDKYEKTFREIIYSVRKTS